MSTLICTDHGVSDRNYLGTCIIVWEPMKKTAHGYVILGGSSWLLTCRKQRKRSVSLGWFDDNKCTCTSTGAFNFIKQLAKGMLIESRNHNLGHIKSIHHNLLCKKSCVLTIKCILTPFYFNTFTGRV